MLISRGQTLFGADAILLYHAARWIKVALGGFSLSDDEEIDVLLFAKAIGMPPQECIPVLRAMVKAQWLGKKSNGKYLLKQPFRQLAMARIGKPLPRTKADALLARIVAEARVINRELESECDFVLEVAVFGSYLDQAKIELGDLDIGVKMQRRTISRELQAKSFDWREKGGYELVWVRLQRRSPYVSLHDMSELDGAGFARRLVYVMKDDLPALAS